MDARVQTLRSQALRGPEQPHTLRGQRAVALPKIATSTAITTVTMAQPSVGPGPGPRSAGSQVAAGPSARKEEPVFLVPRSHLATPDNQCNQWGPEGVGLDPDSQRVLDLVIGTSTSGAPDIVID